jgi:hypothetical protein
MVDKYEEAIQCINIMQSSYNHIRKSDAEFLTLELAKEALREKLEREDPQPLTDVFSGSGGRWGKCIKCGKLNRVEYNYCANCGTRICQPKEDENETD